MNTDFKLPITKAQMCLVDMLMNHHFDFDSEATIEAFESMSDIGVSKELRIVYVDSGDVVFMDADSGTHYEIKLSDLPKTVLMEVLEKSMYATVVS